ncbi:MAG: SusC/RagA family TonB-linked outer membrane protein [Dysgonamonadaceae bacterium]|jgi:TonB-linked SusC/RagA family outer membrane protein|nr:SusC/RagA family TonB-linked outer membrane protein [Dysgonamonadaceae bacterium]
MNKILEKILLITLFFCSISVSIFAYSGKDSLNIDLGYGIVQSKQLATVSAYSITGDELKQTAAFNLQDALYGRLLGLTAINTGGFAGDREKGASLNIRGLQTSSEGQNGVLILVDGFERPIDKLSIDEVESVTVLKDAAATALFGFKGANGAILVKTKSSGADGLKVGVSYDHKFTSNPLIPEFLNASQYVGALNEARANDGLTPAYNQYEVDAFKTNKYPNIYPDVDWRNTALKNTGFDNQLNISITGGNPRLKYFALLNYQNYDGLLNNTEVNDGYSTQLKYSKANVRMNIDSWVTNSTRLSVNASASLYETNRPSGADANEIISYIFNTPSSAFPLKTDAGVWGGNTNAIYGTKNISALIQETGYRKYHGRSYFVDAKIYQDLGAWVQGLSASLRMGYDNSSEINENHSREFQYGNDRYVFDASGNITGTNAYTAGSKTNNLTFARELNYQQRKSNVNFSLDYKKALEESNFQASLIYATEANVDDGRYNTFNRMNVGGYFHYDLKSKYIADFTLLNTGSSRSYPNKFALSPVLSLGWIVSEETALAENSIINYLKLRASAGVLHTDYVPKPGLSYEDYSGGHGNYYFGAGYTTNESRFLGYFPTSTFALETALKYNLGIDVTLLNALNVTAEAYYQRRSNILQSTDGLNSAVLGIPPTYDNKGIVDSKGIELAFDYSKNIKDLSLSLGAFFTYGTNKIIDMVETPKAYPYLSHIGLPVNQYFGLEAIGFFKDNADIAASPNQEFSDVRPGDIKYKDQNGDKVINENDEIALGYNSLVPEINYAFKLGLEYKGLGFNAIFQGAANYSQALTVQGVYTPLVGNVNLSEHYYENAWRSGGSNAAPLYPRLTSETNLNNYRQNSIWYKDVSFLKLRNCELYYKLPHSFLSRYSLNEVKLYVKGENLISFDNIKIMDPEVVSSAYPVLKGISLGAAVKF